jgi:predicted Fe-S protein YdhL (DUF1289 family)
MQEWFIGTSNEKEEVIETCEQEDKEQDMMKKRAEKANEVEN